jgi:hypothetical protein
MGLYVHVVYRGDWWGEEPLTETVHETTGDLFRSLSGRNKTRPWEALGRCTGKVYVDGADGEPRQVGWVFVARNPKDPSDQSGEPSGLREAWVSVHTAPPTVVTTHHYATFDE